MGSKPPTFGLDHAGFQQHANTIDKLQQLAPTWSVIDLVTLVHKNYEFISDPDKCPITKAKWRTKSPQRVNELLAKIRSDPDIELRRLFPEDPRVWTADDVRDIELAIQVRPHATMIRLTSHACIGINYYSRM